MSVRDLLLEAQLKIAEALTLLDAPPPAEARTLAVCVDAGHGGRDSGAVGVGAVLEKNVALEYARELRTVLQRRNHRVALTRMTDEYVELAERVKIADDARADVMVSLHANAADSKLANGAWVIYDDKTDVGPAGGKALAEAIFKSMAKVLGVTDADADLEVFPDRSSAVGGRNLAVLNTKAPAVLVELGFMTNEEDLAQLQNMSARAAICGAIADGIEAWAAGR